MQFELAALSKHRLVRLRLHTIQVVAHEMSANLSAIVVCKTAVVAVQVAARVASTALRLVLFTNLVYLAHHMRVLGPIITVVMLVLIVDVAFAMRVYLWVNYWSKQRSVLKSLASTAIRFLSTILGGGDIMINWSTVTVNPDTAVDNEPQRSPRSFFPTVLTLRHALAFLGQKVNYYIHAVYAAAYCMALPFWHLTTTDEHVVRLILNTTLALYTKVPRKTASGTHKCEMRIRGFAYLLAERFDTNSTLVVDFDLTPRDHGTVLAGADIKQEEEKTKVSEEKVPVSQEEKVPVALSSYYTLFSPFSSWSNVWQSCMRIGRRGSGSAPTKSVQLYDCGITRFEINGRPISMPSEQLYILGVIISTLTHPLMHVFNDAHYATGHLHQERTKTREYDELLLHGQYINFVAFEYPSYLYGVNPQWFSQCAHHNVSTPMPPHSAKSFEPLAPFSPFLSFMLKARTVVFELVAEYKVPANAEEMFLCSVLHSVDHYTTGTLMRWHRMLGSMESKNRCPNLLAQYFYPPSQYVWTNLLCDKADRMPFYGKLYARLHGINPEFANNISLSICY